MNLKYGTKIKMHSTEPFANIVGYVCGKSIEDQSMLGVGYIICPQLSGYAQPLINNEHYPYTHFVAFDCQFDVI